ncbi:MAG TPA: DUF2203 domain-containing protein [Candidatus Limnocylindrales bacterium]|nr:DUF2203 domain-containing protein [Candidatus Limnocylindrales bacterium]
MARFYDIDAANALVPELAGVAGRLRDHRADLIALRDEARARQAAGVPEGGSQDASPDLEIRRIDLRMRGIVDQMQAEVMWLVERSIELREIQTGLLDLPALVAGRQVWLCWRLGEDEIGWWHELTTGFAGRRPLSELE